jgi:hypothetical protein
MFCDFYDGTTARGKFQCEAFTTLDCADYFGFAQQWWKLVQSRLFV